MLRLLKACFHLYEGCGSGVFECLHAGHLELFSSGRWKSVSEWSP